MENITFFRGKNINICIYISFINLLINYNPIGLGLCILVCSPVGRYVVQKDENYIFKMTFRVVCKYSKRKS